MEKIKIIVDSGNSNSLEKIKIMKELLKDEIKNAKLFKEMSVLLVFRVHLRPKSLLVSVIDC